MTRGTIYLYTDKKVYNTTEFNGDMYRGGHYENVVKLLHNVKTTGEFHDLAENINNNYGYDDQLIFAKRIPLSEMDGKTIKLDFSRENYYKLWFSDYVFIKNLSGRKMIIHHDDNEAYEVNHGDVFVSYYYHPDLIYTADEKVVNLGAINGTNNNELNL